MSDVVLDANVLVALLYDADVHHARARALATRLETDGHALVLLDILVYEAVSVLCRRARERKTTPPNLEKALDEVLGWLDGGHVRFVADEASPLARDALAVIRDTAGVLNFNDAFLVVLQRKRFFDVLASFDPGFDAISGFSRVA
jgi:predicted nucleic acid-binding protein